MASRKLSDADKQQILELYRSSGETAASLSNRYGVSNSTISRLLKTELPEAEYEALIQQKRGRSSIEAVEAPAIKVVPAAVPEAENTAPEPAESEVAVPEVAAPAIEAQLETVPPEAVPETEGRRVRKRSSTVGPKIEPKPEPEVEAEPETAVEPEPLPIAAIEPLIEELPVAVPLPVPKARLVIGAPKSIAPPVVSNGFAEGSSVLEEILDEEIVDEDDLDDDLDDLDDEDGDDGDDEPLAEGALLVSRQGKSSVRIQVLPLTDASIPRTCYLVVDRSAELVARPLKEFGDLGAIPDEETQAKTLPVFDNHRVAKRYSNPRTQRVIKLPDGKILQRTSSHLQAKGITRLLIDGQVYSFAGED